MKTKLITPEGYKKLKDEQDYLWQKQRPEITKIVTWAASLGDRSENADYQYNKRKLREIDRRVRYLRKLLPELKVIDYLKKNTFITTGEYSELMDVTSKTAYRDLQELIEVELIKKTGKNKGAKYTLN